jgi:hypothetical protein
MARRFCIARSDLRTTCWVDAPTRALAEGELRLGLECFALTSNNVTYAAFGETMHSWRFFPTGDAATGCLPVWGFATVHESRCEGIDVGERFYGYLPIAEELVVQPARVTRSGFVDASAHRRELDAVYNHDLRCSADPGYEPQREAEQALLRPLFTTSFLIDDFLADNGAFGARRAIHTRCDAALKHSASVGGTHWDTLTAKGASRSLPGPRPTRFFAPAQINKRLADWGPAGLQQRLAAAWLAFVQPVTAARPPWLRVVHGYGANAVAAVYRSLLDGRADPREGHMLALHAQAIAP